MAKVKIQLDVATIKKWLLQHGEKLAFGFTLLIFMMFTWSAISREVLEPTKQPPQLQNTAAQVGSHVKSSPWDEKTATTQVIAYDKRAQRARVDPKTFVLPRPFNPLLADPKTKRAAPELLPIEELKVAAGFGAFALKGGEASLKGHAWVVITGLVPVQKQAGEYARVFDRAQGGDRPRDVPKYTGFKLERAEISDLDPNKLEWKPLATAPIVKEFANTPVAEVVNSDFVDPVLTMPLKPLVTPDWGDAVTHPKIPLAVPGKAPVAPLPAAEEPAQAENETPDGFQQAGGKNPVPKVPAKDDKQPEKPDDIELGYHLFRGFDFSVEPNKKYRYRVIVRLENPNFGISLQHLQDPESAKQEYLFTEPTEPSGVASVPDAYQVLAGAVKPPKVGEPSAKMMLIAIDEETGMEATYDHDVQRGTVANTVKDVKVRNPRNPSEVKEMTGVSFKTDMLVLDIRGGKVLPLKSKPTAPGEVLLLDRNGDLIVRHELDDQSMYQTRAIPVEELEKHPDPLEAPKKPATKKPKR